MRSLAEEFPRDSFLGRFVEMMDDDLNTSGAIGLVFEKVRDMNRVMDGIQGDVDEEILHSLRTDRHQLHLIGRTLGLFQETPEEFFDQVSEGSDRIDHVKIEELVEERTVARGRKDWARSDEIRDQLKEMGVILEDGPKGTSWRLDV